jgi:hypothetical protein
MLDNLKVEALSDRQFRFWMKLLAVANVSRPRGSLPFPAVIAFRTRTPLPTVIKLLGELGEAGLVSCGADGYAAHDWDEWQWESDARATDGRQRRGESAAVAPRIRRASAAKAPPRAETETEKETEAEAEQTQKPREPEGFTLKTDPLEPDEPGFVGEYTRHLAAQGRIPSAAATAAAANIERVYGTKACVEVATDLNWQKHPSYMEPILKERKDGRTTQTGRLQPRGNARGARPTSDGSDVAAYLAQRAQERAEWEASAKHV